MQDNTLDSQFSYQMTNGVSSFGIHVLPDIFSARGFVELKVSFLALISVPRDVFCYCLSRQVN